MIASQSWTGTTAHTRTSAPKAQLTHCPRLLPDLTRAHLPQRVGSKRTPSRHNRKNGTRSPQSRPTTDLQSRCPQDFPDLLASVRKRRSASRSIPRPGSKPSPAETERSWIMAKDFPGWHSGISVVRPQTNLAMNSGQFCGERSQRGLKVTSEVTSIPVPCVHANGRPAGFRPCERRFERNEQYSHQMATPLALTERRPTPHQRGRFSIRTGTNDLTLGCKHLWLRGTPNRGIGTDQRRPRRPPEEIDKHAVGNLLPHMSVSLLRQAHKATLLPKSFRYPCRACAPIGFTVVPKRCERGLSLTRK